MYVDEHTDIETFVLDSLLPKNKDDYYRYNGSLTTPPCYESVIWTVFKDPITMSQAQVIDIKYRVAQKK